MECPLNLGERFFSSQKAILSFLWYPHIPIDNNQADRDVRMVKVKQKVYVPFEQKAWRFGLPDYGA
ncbi:IS66 family transposase [Paenibacillus sp. FSL R7-0333]|uniref:IS66 family transposase n=1 Tax=Paenibacillus sp. FSL R7-0333 TaxID=1926587 RepID=UPI00096C2888|nr:hypothetical protein BK146_29990 [Paenibacillus sp. FSL R7-0333]